MKLIWVCVVALFVAAPLCLGDEEHDGNGVETAVGKTETADHAAWRTLLVDKIGTLKKTDRDKQTDEALGARDILNQELMNILPLDRSGSIAIWGLGGCGYVKLFVSDVERFCI